MDYYTLDRKSVAEILRISLRTIDRYVAKKTFSTERKNGKIFFHSKEVEDFLQEKSIEGIDTSFAAQSTRLNNIKSFYSQQNTPEISQKSMAKDVAKYHGDNFSELQKKTQKYELEAKMYKNMYETSQQLFMSQQEQLQSAHYRLGKLEEKIKASESQEVEEMTLLRNKVTETEISYIVARWTGIPVDKMMAAEKENLLNMESIIHERLIGQEKAVEVISDGVRRARAGLSDPSKPDGSFLFMGPTGVGKTELTKALADFLFDTEQAIVRIDMSEFMEKHSVARMIGSPPGYVGFEQGGVLT
ncbi:AAA domain-containing protein, partial [Candidatus Peregrinibacteria bacterium]|nr:AAA domain-containing protein [Candidatus Peregrinibacteria bacterium]